MTQVPPAQQCVLDECDRAARDTSRGGSFCETHDAQMVDVTENATLPADDSTTEQSPNDAASDYMPDEDGAYSPDEIDLDDVEPDTYPEDLVEAGARWLLWQNSDGRKVPRNPRWGSSERDGGYAFVGAKNPDAWFEFESAHYWIDHDEELGLAYYLTAPDRSDWDDDSSYESVDPASDVPEEPHVGLLDFDEVRDPETGAVAPAAAALLDQLAGTFCEWSPSGTGAHALGGFRLPDDVQTLTIDLSSPEWPDAELELYPGHRYTTVTGDHIPGSAPSTRDIQGTVDDILAHYPGALEAAQASMPESRPDDLDASPNTSKEALADIETTDDMQDVFDAIQHTEPSDIRLRSRVTYERSDGSKNLDPSWVQSKSGTRLAELDDGWVYRKGMIGLDALQTVASRRASSPLRPRIPAAMTSGPPSRHCAIVAPTSRSTNPTPEPATREYDSPGETRRARRGAASARGR